MLDTLRFFDLLALFETVVTRMIIVSPCQLRTVPEATSKKTRPVKKPNTIEEKIRNL